MTADNSNGSVSSLARPGIPEDVLRTHGVRHVGDLEAVILAGHRISGIAIPYHTANGEPLIVNGEHFHRLRPDDSVRNGAKYLSPKEGGCQLYIPLWQDFSNVEELVIAESEFKTLCLALRGIPAVGLGGFSSGLPGGKLLPALEGLLRSMPKLKTVYFLGDSDTSTNFQFAREAVKLAKALKARKGCILKLPRIGVKLPKGIDDVAEQLGDGFEAFWEDVKAKAVEVPPKVGPEAVASTLAIRELVDISQSDNRDTHIQRLVELGAHIESGNAIAFNKLAAEVRGVLNIPIPTFRKASKQAAKQKDRNWGEPERDETTDSGMHAELAAKHGDPFFLNRQGEISGVNEAYFVHKFALEHQVLFEQAERAFFEYNPSTGAWEKVDKDVIKEALRTDWEKFAPIGVRHFATDSLLNALTSGVRSLVGRDRAFKRLERGLLHVRNGMLRITSADECTLLPFDAEYYSRNPLACAFNPDAKAPRFEAMLLYPLDEEDGDLLMRYFGSCLIEGNHAQRFVMLIGAPKSAKTTIVNIITNTIGRRNAGELRTQHLDERFEIGRLIGRTLLTARDVTGSFMQQRGTHVVKKLVGHDYLDGEIKGSMNSVEVVGDFAVIITSNERILVTLHGEDDVNAWRRRMIILSFNKSVAAKDRVADLDQVLLREEGEGILYLAIQGAIKHLKELENGGDFGPTKDQQDRVDKLLIDSQSVEFFVQDEIVQDPDGDLATDEVLFAYVEFCKVRGLTVQSSKMVERQLPDLMLSIHGARHSKHITRGDSRSIRGYTQVKFNHAP